MEPLTVLPSANGPSSRMPNQAANCWESEMARHTRARGARSSTRFSIRSVLDASWVAIMALVLVGCCSATVVLRIIGGGAAKRNWWVACQDKGDPLILRPPMPFSSATLRFFRDLARHNNKPWFEAHRADYERDVKEPMRELIELLDVRLARFAPEITGDPKRSMFRINRDIRFSKDKSPYKTNAACWFWHRDADPRVGDSAEAGG